MQKDKVILLGHGGSGKDYFANYLSNKGFKRNISYTTRPQREGEVEGVDYYFISNEDFQKKIGEGFWHEYNIFVGDWYYGASKDEFERCNLFIKEPRGLSLLSEEERNRSYVIYINTPRDIRKDRMLERKKNADNVDRRLDADDADFKNFIDFDCEVTNPIFDNETLYNKVLENIEYSAVPSRPTVPNEVYFRYTEKYDNFISYNDFLNESINNKTMGDMFNRISTEVENN